MVKLDRYVGSCNTLNDLYNKICIPNKTRFKSESLQHDCRDKWIENTNKTFHASVNVNLIEQNASRINGGLTIKVDVSVKNITYLKQILFGILVHVVVKTENI